MAPKSGRTEAEMARTLLVGALEAAWREAFYRRVAEAYSPELRARDLDVLRAFERLDGLVRLIGQWGDPRTIMSGDRGFSPRPPRRRVAREDPQLRVRQRRPSTSFPRVVPLKPVPPEIQ